MTESTSNTTRIDKWLWAVRIFKTRSQASDACKKGKIIVNNIAVKPSYAVKTGDIVFVKKLPVIYSYKVKYVLEKRLSAKLIGEYVENVTPDKELQKIEANKFVFFIKHDRGSGRPTKKDRRIIDKIKKANP